MESLSSRETTVNVAPTLRSDIVPIQQNDPHELLEVFDAAGNPTGVARSRAAIHLNGDWHQAFHCWILRHQAREVVLQRRALDKDTFGGCWDASAAGHWRFGESAAQAAREIAEELGIEVDFADLVYRGTERTARRRFSNGLLDREHHQVYVLVSDLPLSAYRPDPREVVGLAAFDVQALVALVSRQADTLVARQSVRVEPDGSLHADRVVATRDDLVPYSAARLRRMLRPVSGR